jgi:small neutral amino acid transporter SnatA (MarC family)
VTIALLAVAAVVAVNPFRARAAVPEEGGVRIAALGAAAATALLLPIVALADPILDALHVAAATARIGAGAALAVVGAAELVLRLPRPEPALEGRRAALVPIAFPVLLTPAVGLLAVSGSADRGAGVALVVLAGAMATVPVATAVLPPGRSALGDRVAVGLARLTAAGLVAVGLALVLDGVFDI